MTPTPTANPFNPSADPRDALARCEQAVRDNRWFDRAELAEHWPVSTAEAALLLSEGGEYDLDAEQLADLVQRRLIPAPAEDEFGYEFGAEDIVRLTGILEARGQWQPTPSKHDAKKHATRLLLEQARATGELSEVAHGGPVDFDLRHLVQLLVVCDVREGREKVAALLEAVLESDHGVIL